MPSPSLRHVLLLAIALAAPAALSQSTPQIQSTPSPTGPQYTLRARVPLTIVDVTVTDAKGHPVHNLKQSDFTLLEDNQPMRLASFDEHRTDTTAPAPTTLPQQTRPPNTFTNAIPNPPNATPINILLLDNLNTPAQAQQQVTQRMLDFVAQLAPGTQVAVFRLTTHLAILQGFTSDRELLRTALTSKSNFAWPSPIGDGDAVSIEDEGNHSAMQGQYTLSAMRQIARYVSGMPGRKNLIWFSGSFPLQFPPVTDPIAFPGTTSQGSVYDFTDDMKSATDLMARAHLVLYPIDWRGPKQLQPAATPSGLTNRGNMLFAERGTMQDIADQTGGKFFFNTNDYVGAVDESLDTGSNFYTLTYVPTNQTLDTRFRTIKVTVAQPGLHLTYRNGYYAVDPTTDARGHKIDATTPMQAAMMRGALPATQILFRVKAVESPTTASLAPDNQPDPKQMKPPYRRYSISYIIDVHGIAFAPGSDGNYRGDFEYGVRVYNADGDEIVNSTSKTVSPILLPAVYQSMLRTGANAHRDIDVPATGDYFLRIAVHDLATNRVGSIEIPTSSITPDPAPAK
jgi:VWFA-related protein